MLNLRKIFKDLNGLTFIGVTAETVPKLTGGKSNPMQELITKRTELAGMAYTNTNTNTYVNLVRKEIEGFEVKPRKWGNRVEGLPIVEHKGNDYLEMVVQTVKKVEFFLNGQPIDKKDITGLPKSKPSSHNVIIRDYKAESIVELRHAKQIFVA